MPNSDEKVIRFIDSCYNNLFSLPDGGTLVIVRDDGEVVEKPCHYVDDYHFKVRDTRGIFANLPSVWKKTMRNIFRKGIISVGRLIATA